MNAILIFLLLCSTIINLLMVQPTTICNPCPDPTFNCNADVLCHFFVNQNMCVLSDEIPQELRNLPYVVYPTCPNYNIERFLYNKRFNVFPHAIIKPCTEQQLLFALSVLKKNNLEFAIRGGGHCYEPGSISPGYVIDVANFNQVTIDFDKQEVFVGAGSLLGNVIKILAKFNFAIPTGTCGSNGVAGLTMGGGVGFLARAFGLTCDVVKSIRIATADLRIITVDDQNFSDLFYALRGAGGGSYGVVVGFTFKIFCVPKVTFFEFVWNWTPQLAQQVAAAWQSWIQTLPNSITAEMDFDYFPDGTRTITVGGLKVGTEPFTEWIPVFKPLNPQKTTIKLVSYLEAAELEGGEPTIPFAKIKSKMIFKPIPPAGINVIIKFFTDLFNQKKQFRVHLEFDSGRGKVLEGNSAYFPRTALAWFFQQLYWNDQTQEADGVFTINKFYKDIEPFTSPFSYANVIDYDLGNTYLNAYYGDHVDTLIAIKNKYDPTNFFHWKQSIPLSR